MEFNQPSEIVKDLTFNDNAQTKIMQGVDKLNSAVSSTLGASGKCVIYEDAMGRPIITKDGVTVAQSVVLMDPVENIGATLIKEAAQNTVKEAGDGTTTSTVLAHAILEQYYSNYSNSNLRDVKNSIIKIKDSILKYLEKESISVKDKMLENVARISTNNDSFLGSIIADAYNKVGKNGVVLMEESDDDKTCVEIVDGVQFDSGLKSPHFITNTEKGKCELNNPLILLVESEINSVRRIQSVLEYAIKNDRAILIVGNVAPQPMSALIMNKAKGNIKANIIDSPGFSTIKKDMLEDLSIITGARVINEDLGDDLDLIDETFLGEAVKSVTDDTGTIITVGEQTDEIKNRILQIEDQLDQEQNPYLKKKLEQRRAMLSGSVGIIKVGADSKVELKEKKDRIEDAIYAVKAALKEGIVAGGGVALLNASTYIKPKNKEDQLLLDAIKSPYLTILKNANIGERYADKKGVGLDVVSGKDVNMIKAGIIDPVLVTKTALTNAVSVATTIMSADCVISNVREQ
jgi:chaperonin GroEL